MFIGQNRKRRDLCEGAKLLPVPIAVVFNSDRLDCIMMALLMLAFSALQLDRGNM